MYCTQCGARNDPDANFCERCGSPLSKAQKPAEPERPAVIHNTRQENTVPEASHTTEQPMPAGKDIIKCGNCGYIGPGEPARSTWAKILAWICVFGAPLITILYFVATHKYRCPNCHSTFLGVRNKEGKFTQGQSPTARVITIVVAVLVGIAVMGILAAVVLASLDTARSKGTDASIQSYLDGVRTQAEIYYGGAGYNSYGLGTGSCYSGMFSDDSTIAQALANISAVNGASVQCNVSDDGSAYAVEAKLVSDGAGYWCVDSTGISKQDTYVLGTDTVCP